MAHYPIDNANPLWVKGWGVLRPGPWHLHGLYPSRAQADIQQAALGSSYKVVYGTRRLASDDFIYGSEEELAAVPREATRWEKTSGYIELEGVSGDNGPALIVGTNIPWAELPLEFREQVPLAAEEKCWALYQTAKAWAERKGFTRKSAA